MNTLKWWKRILRNKLQKLGPDVHDGDPEWTKVILGTDESYLKGDLDGKF